MSSLPNRRPPPRSVFVCNCPIRAGALRLAGHECQPSIVWDPPEVFVCNRRVCYPVRMFVARAD